jgi:hypothetical protein
VTSRRRRLKRLVVSVELEPAEIEVLVKRGYLDPGDRENLGPIQEAANAFISDALVGATSGALRRNAVRRARGAFSIVVER